MLLLKRLSILFLLCTPAYSAESYQGTVVKVFDGDSIAVKVDGWPNPFNPVVVRFAGIDSAESMSQFAKCKKELKLGLMAKAWLKEKLPVDSRVDLIWTGEHEKFGRLLATVMFKDENLNKSLVKKGMAVPYDGGTKINWCK